MRVALALLAVVAGAACPPADCPRRVIAGGGQAEDGGHLHAEFFPYGVEGLDVTGTVWAPLTACEGDRVTARASFQSPAGETTTLSVSELTVHDGGAVSGVVTVPAQPLGAPGVLSVDFEPGLGRRTIVATVLPRASLEGTGVGLSHPVSDCATTLTALDSQTVGCGVGTEFVASMADGGEVRFTAYGPVALEGVVWSVAEDGFFEFREFGGSVIGIQRGLVDPPNLPSTAVALSRELGPLQTIGGASMRRLLDGGIVQVDHSHTDGNRFHFTFGPLTWCSQCDWDAFGVDLSYPFRWKTTGVCFPDPGNAQCHDNVLGIDSYGKWIPTANGTERISPGRPPLRVDHRPLPPVFPQNGFGELIPWFPAAGDFRALAWAQPDGGLGLGAFPQGVVPVGDVELRGGAGQQRP